MDASGPPVPTRAGAPGARSAARRGARRFLALFAVGAVGVAASLPVVEPIVRDLLGSLEEAPDLPIAAVVALSLVNPLLVVALAVAVGVALAPRVGLRSHLADAADGFGVDRTAVARAWPLAVAVGVVVGLALVGLDAATRPLLGAAGEALSLLEGRTWVVTFVGVVYGGVAEELMLRWGLTTLLVWLAWRLGGRGVGRPTAAHFWIAIGVAAVVFGLLHLPAVSAEVALTGPVVARTVALNALGGIAFGWLFWRFSLEAAMVAHAVAHLAMSAVALVVA